MKKYLALPLVLALFLVLSACISPSGLVLKEAWLKQMEVESYESNSELSVELDTVMMKNSFEVDMYMKQVDMLNSVIEINLDEDLLLLASFTPNQNENNQVTLQMFTNGGNTIIGSPEDDIGILFSNMSMMTEEYDEEKEFNEEEFEKLVVTLQETARELMKVYIDEYGFDLKQIEDHGEVVIELPNGENVTTQHIEVQLSMLDVVEMLQYSLDHFLENEEFQELFYGMIVDLPELMSDFVGEDLSGEVEELEGMMDEIQSEGNAAIEDLIIQIEKIKTDYLLEYEDILNDFASLSVDTYIGVEDKETYQVEYTLELTYTEEMAELELEGTEDILLYPGDSITIATKDQIWNHHKSLDPISLPNQIITMEEIMEMESIEEFAETFGENSLFTQAADMLYYSIMDVAGVGFVEFKVGENKAETINGEIDTHLYMKDGQLIVPLGFLSEAMGAEVTWIDETRQIVVASPNGHIMTVDVDNNNAVSLNGELRSDIFVEVQNGTSYVNVRNYAEAMGWTVLWIEETNSAAVFQ